MLVDLSKMEILELRILVSGALDTIQDILKDASSPDEIVKAGVEAELRNLKSIQLKLHRAQGDHPCT